jgi:outer membrane protein assembly factor BamE (lipoprotein component of BamABCDE complex)
MTKAQVLARYGNPNHKTSTEQGETWMYILNMGQFIGKHMIPFFFSTQTLHTGTVAFGQDGRVKTFRWDRPED